MRDVCGALGVLIFLAACQPTPAPAPATLPRPSPVASPTNGVTGPPAATVSPAAPPTQAASATVTAAGPRELTICLAGEPQSLYRYARPEPGREHILAALYDGPIDTVNFGFQPVLFDHLPSLANGDAVISNTIVISGETVVDALGRVQPLAPGLRLRLADESVFTYDGNGSTYLPQMVVTFHLRPGLRWSDGAPLTADDSAFSFSVARSDDAFDTMRDAGDRTASYQATDATTIVWTGLPGDLDPLYMTRFWPPLPRHQLGNLTAAQIAASDQAARPPLGWGPFMIQEWQPGQRLVVQRNPYYWRAAEGLPRLDRVTYRFVGGPADLAAGLRDGTCDIAPSGPAMDQASASLQADAQAGTVSLQTMLGTTLEHLDFDLAPAADYTGTASSGLFQDARVRQAFAYCLDRRALAPGGQVGADYVPPPFARVSSRYLFDPAQGRSLLAQAGWINSNGEGWLDKSGALLTLTLAGDDAHQPLMQAIQAQLQKNCGIGVTLRSLTLGELMGDWPDGVIFGRRFDLAVFPWRIGAVTPCEIFTTAEIASASNPGGANDTGHSSQAFDFECQFARFSLDFAQDEARQIRAYNLLGEDLPMLPLFLEPRRGAARPGVQGYTLDPSSPSELWNIEVIQ